MKVSIKQAMNTVTIRTERHGLHDPMYWAMTLPVDSSVQGPVREAAHNAVGSAVDSAVQWPVYSAVWLAVDRAVSRG